MFQITQLYIYPIKGMAGIAMHEATIALGGFELDRCWMLVDKDNNFVSQRNLPAMALAKVFDKNDSIEIAYLGEQISFHKNEVYGTPILTKVWDDFPMAYRVNPKIDLNLSKWFNMEISLVKIIPSSREVPAGYVNDAYALSFADGFPYLLIGESSLANLNEKLAEKVSMNRFRPNLVFSGGEAFVEDTFNELSIGSNRFKMAKPCARCNVTTINQETAVQSKEPLATLAKYRAFDYKVMFGVNLIALNKNGTIRVGDPLVPFVKND